MSDVQATASDKGRGSHLASSSEPSSIVSTDVTEPSSPGLCTRTPQGTLSKRRPPPPPPPPVPPTAVIQTTHKTFFTGLLERADTNKKQPRHEKIIQPPPVTKILTTGRWISRKPPPRPLTVSSKDGTIGAINKPIQNIRPSCAITSTMTQHAVRVKEKPVIKPKPVGLRR